MREAAHGANIQGSLLEDPNFVGGTGPAELVDAEADIDQAGIGDRAKEVALRAHDKPDLTVRCWVDCALLKEVLVDNGVDPCVTWSDEFRHSSTGT